MNNIVGILYAIVLVIILGLSIMMMGLDYQVAAQNQRIAALVVAIRQTQDMVAAYEAVPKPPARLVCSVGQVVHAYPVCPDPNPYRFLDQAAAGLCRESETKGGER